jgi:hypothetical protein
MSRAEPLYEPPKTGSMAGGQNGPRALRLLLAQRRLCSRAQRWSLLLAAPILTTVVPDAAVVVGAIAGVWIFLSRTRFTGAEQAVADSERLKDWYPFDSRVDGAMSISIAQRANAAYSERLLTANAHVWLVATQAWSGAAVIASLIVGLTLPQGWGRPVGRVLCLTLSDLA